MSVAICQLLKKWGTYWRSHIHTKLGWILVSLWIAGLISYQWENTWKSLCQKKWHQTVSENKFNLTLITLAYFHLHNKQNILWFTQLQIKTVHLEPLQCHSHGQWRTRLWRTNM